MLPRQKDIFNNIVQEYIKTAQPVGSKLIVDKYHTDVSPATVRNDMAELEDQGLVFQPHISAGRIPTEYGYKYFVENYVNLNLRLAEKTVDKIEVIESLHAGPGGLDESAIAAVKQWKIKPVKSNGKPIAMWVKFPVSFGFE
jgi:heat shock gene repressor HrcA